ncbi:phage tail protein [Salinicoccus albus]|uniref:phage tail protein n=1 Tax=Salinicoccus albus TaxID=418756 RepID=UPI00036192FB|nr:phage tail protein [Salinicoccus albus]
MLTVTSLNNVTYAAIAEVPRKRSINGEREITLSFLRNEINDEFIENIETGWTVNFKGDIYHLFNEKEDMHGNKEFDAVLDFFHYFNGFWHVDDVENKSMTIDHSIPPLFEGTKYLLNIIDTFHANTMSYSKQENSTQRFLYFISRHNAEFNIPIGTQTVQIRNRIGNQRNDVLIHEDDNLIDFNITTDTDSFCTAIKGYYDFQGDDDEGSDKEPTKTYEYISPMAEKYGVIWGEPIHDERYSTLDGIQEALKTKQESTWKTSFELSAELFEYPLNEGDEVRFVVPSKGINDYIRVVEINEEFDEDGELISSDYTFGNENISQQYRNMQYDSIQDIQDLIDGKRKLPYNVLPNAVREATNIINAGEDSHFEYRRNGIYGYNLNNTQGVTRYNANGIGFSQDGGQTFNNALTYTGIVADAITTGSMTANRIAGGILRSINNNTLFNLNTGKLQMSNADFELGGSASIEFTDTRNQIYYRRFDDVGGINRTAGVGVDRSINGRFPVVYLGTTNKNNLSSRDEDNFAGFIANTRQREILDGAGQSIVGRKVFIRNESFDFDKGYNIDMHSRTITFHPMYTAENSYYMGTDTGIFDRTYSQQIRGDKNVQIRDAFGYGGWQFSTDWRSGGANLAILGLNTNTYYYQIGREGSPLTFGYINSVHADWLRGELVGSSSRKFKKNEGEMNLKDSVEFIKNAKIKTFDWIIDEESKFNKDNPQTVNDRQVGFIIDDLKMNNDHLVKRDDETIKKDNIIFMHQQVIQNLLNRVEVLENGKK